MRRSIFVKLQDESLLYRCDSRIETLLAQRQLGNNIIDCLSSSVKFFRGETVFVSDGVRSSTQQGVLGLQAVLKAPTRVLRWVTDFKDQFDASIDRLAQGKVART